MLEDWHQGLPVRLTSRTSVFLPPHLFNLVGNRAAHSLLAATDRLCSLVPGYAEQGGIIIFEIQKTAETDGRRSRARSAAE